MLNLRKTLKHMRIWSGIRCPSTNSNPRCVHKSFIILLTCSRNFPYSLFLRYLAIIATWFMHSHPTCDKLLQSCIGSSSCSLRLEISRWKNLFFFRRDGRIFPGPPPEVVGLDQTDLSTWIARQKLVIKKSSLGQTGCLCENPNISAGLEIDNTTGIRYLNIGRRLPQFGSLLISGPNGY